MRRFITGIFAGALALGAIAGPALANQCPLLIKQINDAAGGRLDDAGYRARTLAADADALHKAAKHAESVAKAQEAAKAIGLQLKMK